MDAGPPAAGPRATTTRRIATSFAGFFALGITLAFLESTQLYFRQTRTTTPDRFWWVFTHMLPPWLILAAIGPSVILLARAIPLRRGTLYKAIPIQLVAMPGFVVTHLGLLALYNSTFGEIASASSYFLDLIANYSLSDIGIYWAIAGTVYAWDYNRELSRAEVNAANLQASLSEAKLKALRWQLNPHFLFNSLNSVSMLMREGSSDAAVGMLAKVGDLLRYVLHDHNDAEVPLGEEIDFIEKYLDVERIRFGDRVAISVEVPVELRSALVPSLVLQPLVENAIRHGVGTVTSKGLIEIVAFRQNGVLRMEVRDNGRGLSGAPNGNGRIGVANSRERLEQLYGRDGALEIRNGENNGVTASIEIPYRTL